MTTNVVKSKEDEELWGRAKEQAAKEGKPKKYALIMFLFRRFQKAHEAEEPDTEAKSEGDRKAAEAEKAPKKSAKERFVDSRNTKRTPDQKAELERRKANAKNYLGKYD